MTDPTPTPLATAVRLWHDACVEADTAIDKLDDAVGLEPESPLRHAIWALTGGWLEALDRQWNIGPWLEWWRDDCRLGENPMEAGVRGSPMRKIRTIEDLIQIIEADRAASDTELEPANMHTQTQLAAVIKRTSKYRNQATEPFPVTIAPDPACGYVVKGGPGGQYRLADVTLYAVANGQRIPIKR